MDEITYPYTYLSWTSLVKGARDVYVYIQVTLYRLYRKVWSALQSLPYRSTYFTGHH